MQIVGDALPNVHVMDALFSFTDLKDVPGIMQQLEGLANGFRYSVKPQHYGYMKDSDQFAIKMAQALGVTLDAEIDVAPPVAFGDEALEAIWRFAELGWCVWASPGGRAGATAPGPLASVLVQSWAGTMAFIVVAQLINARHAGGPAPVRRRRARQVGPRPPRRSRDLVRAGDDQPALPRASASR